MKKKITDALKAIDVVFSDTTVSQEHTISALQELIDDIADKIDAIKADMQRQR